MLVSEVIMPRMTELEASDLAARAMDAALRKGLHIAVAVVDSAGQLMVFRRDRDAFPASIELAIAKARTAAAALGSSWGKTVPTHPCAKHAKRKPS